MKILLPFASASLALGLIMTSVSGSDRLTLQPGKSGRSETIAPSGMVCACHPLAVQAGLEVLRKGGNAIDAAIAVNAVLGVVEPMSNGLGGDLFAIVYEAKTGKLHGLNASGRAPALATREYFASKGMKSIPATGPLSWSVPGCVDGWETLRARFGTKPFAELMAPAIHYADKGAPVPEVIAGYWKSSESRMMRHPGSKAVFFPEGRAPAKGELFRNPALAKTLRHLAENGAASFYEGEIAKKLEEFSIASGGLIRMADLKANKSTWIDPVSSSYRGIDVYELPPNGQGIAALQILNVLENHDIRKMGFASPEYWHLFVEAKKLAYADRARYYADPEFVKVPVKELISKSYAKARMALIKPDAVLDKVDAGDPKIGQSDTTYFCVVDKDRNCVSMIQSNYEGFGSGLTPADLGFGMQNRGTLFSLDANHPNRLEPGKRPFHTIIPAMAMKDGKPWLVFGLMGGDMQAQGHAQVIVNMVDFGMDVQAAGEAPRIEHRGSAGPKGEPAAGSGTIQAEQGMPQAVVEGLKKLGHTVRSIRTNGGGYQAIMIHPKTGMLHGGTETRKDGIAGGY